MVYDNMIKRAKMCNNKENFRDKKRAEAMAVKWSQRVYECPVCFCYHLTSKENWRDDYMETAKAKKQLAQLEATLKVEFKKTLKEKNKKISDLEWQLSRK